MKKTGYPSIDKTHLEGIPKEYLEPNIVPLSIYGAFCKINKDRLSDAAVEFGDTVKYKVNVKADAAFAMKSLICFGLKKGDVIAILSKNCYEEIITVMAANAIGVKVVILNVDDVSGNNIQLIETFEPVMLFTTSTDWKVLYLFLKSAKSIKHIVYLSGGTNSDGYFYDFRDFLLAGKNYDNGKLIEVIEENALNEDICLYLQTSGSKSGRPKILPFSNRAIIASLIYTSNSTGTKTNDATVNKVLCILPIRLAYGFMTLFANLMAGNTVALADGATPEDIAKYYLRKPSYIYGTPLILKAFMLLTPQDADLSFITAFFCAGFAMSEEWYQEGAEYLKAHNSKGEIRNNYGIGEGMCIGTASDGIPHKPNMSGKFFVGPKWLLLDSQMNEVKYGEAGEAYVYSQSLCDGYLNDPQATEASFRTLSDGRRYYRTGDMLILYEDGYVQYLGRKERFYQPAGATDKVNCKTIEDALCAIPEVRVAAVVVKYDKNGYEYGRAYVEVGKEVTSEKIVDILKDRLLEYQMPQEIVVLEKIPMMESGKINYAKLSLM